MKTCRHPTCSGICRREKKPKKVHKIRKVSKKRAKDNKVYSELRKAFLNENPLCEVCCRLATDVHHTKGRGKKDFLDTATWKRLCRECHIMIETHPEWAKEMGFSSSRLQAKEINP
jgi:hypothetical protein